MARFSKVFRILIPSLLLLGFIVISTQGQEKPLSPKEDKKPSRQISKPKIAAQPVQAPAEVEEIGLAEPGSDAAKRIEIMKQQIKDGTMIPNFQRRPPISDNVDPIPPYKGTRVVPNKDLFDSLSVQQAFAQAMAQNDPQPPSRLDHFAWIAQRYPMKLLGWQSSVRGVTPLPDGWNITVTMNPIVYIPKTRFMTIDLIEETYFFSADDLTLINTTAHIIDPEKQRNWIGR